MHSINTLPTRKATRSIWNLLDNTQEILPRARIRDQTSIVPRTVLLHSARHVGHHIELGLWLGVGIFDLEIVGVCSCLGECGLQGEVQLFKRRNGGAGERAG